ncbi:MAG TPA: helix-turn-helix transcriptional regulator [Longimicrobium sp.]|nr:helix-turn-helix transcriptional regulator [Longimicrobium sp.]
MIRTEHEYQRALASLKRDAEVMEAERSQLRERGISGEGVELALQPMESFRQQLEEEVRAYERMKRGEFDVLHSLTGIGRWLIGIRIARGMTQRELAERLSVSEAQVSRDERHEYYGITVERAQRILEALGTRFRMEIEEPVGATHGDAFVSP